MELNVFVQGVGAVVHVILLTNWENRRINHWEKFATAHGVSVARKQVGDRKPEVVDPTVQRPAVLPARE